MDQAKRQRLKQLANDSIIATFGQETNEARLAQALESTVDALEYYDETMERNAALEEENGELDDQVKELTEAIRGIYRVSKSASSSDVKRLAEIQEICEEADVDLSKIV